MRKGFIIIVVISITAIASLLLALFLAPLRTSYNQYTSRIAEVSLTAAGVDFNAVNNVRRASNVGQYETAGFDVPTSTTNAKRKTNVRAYSNLFGFSNNGTYAAMAAMNNTDVKSGGVGAGGGAGMGFAGNTGRGASNNVGSQTNSFIASITDLTGNGGVIVPTTTTRQAGGSNPGAGGPPPEEGEIINLPVGDGTSILLLLALAFVGFKAFNGKF
jgi:hypothetical protein